MEKLPLISVIVPVYNVEPYLEKCVQSIAFQTYRNIEILLVDDGSTDKSGNLCDALSAKYSRVKVFHKQNGGLSSARNYAMDRMKGEYFFFVDSDDYIGCDAIWKLYHACLFLNVPIVECAYLKVKSDLAFSSQKTSAMRVDDVEVFLTKLVEWKEHFPMAWNKLYKTSVFGEYRFAEGKLNEDEFFVTSWISSVKKIGYLDSVLYYYRERENSIMSRPYTLARADAIQAYVERYLLEKSLYPSVCSATIKMICNQVIGKVKLVTTQNNDTDFSIRKRIVGLFLPVLHDALACSALDGKTRALLEKFDGDVQKFIKEIIAK